MSRAANVVSEDLVHDRYVPTREATGILGVSEDTLERWRARRRGPAYTRIGRLILYRVSALHEFMKAHEVQPNVCGDSAGAHTGA